MVKRSSSSYMPCLHISFIIIICQVLLTISSPNTVLILLIKVPEVYSISCLFVYILNVYINKSVTLCSHWFVVWNLTHHNLGLRRVIKLLSSNVLISFSYSFMLDGKKNFFTYIFYFLQIFSKTGIT